MNSEVKGITPVVTTVLMLVLVIGLASGAVYFLNNQQEEITNRLSQAVEENLKVEDITCNGDMVRFYFSNEGDARIESGQADLLVYREGNIDGNFSSKRISPEGDFLSPGGEGFLKVNMDGNFTSGEIYNIEMDFLDSRSKLSKLCRAGQDWWNLNWDYRRQVRVSGEEDPEDDLTSTEIDTDALIGQGKLQSDCSDLRVIEDVKISDYNITRCGETDSRIYFYSEDLDGTEFDTYLYYGNIRADEKPSGTDLAGSLKVDEEVDTELMKEEELNY